MKKCIYFLVIFCALFVLICAPTSLSLDNPKNSELTSNEVQQENQNRDSDKFVMIAENKRYSLMLQPDSGRIIVNDTKNGFNWTSTPDNFDANKDLPGRIKMAYDSQILFKYSDLSGNIYEVNSKVGSINKNGYTYKEIENGFIATYDFEKEKIKIPVKFLLQDDGLKVSVNISEITEGEDAFNLVSISILPYFSAGGLKDEGYLMIPDGSGAIVNFNNNKSQYGDYSEHVYGRDSSIEVQMLDTNKQDIKLPVFGIKKNNQALIGIISKGDARTSINASISGLRSDFNNAFAECIIKENAMASFNDKAWNKKEVRVFENTTAYDKEFEVYYKLLDKNSGYSEMAVAYQNYLFDKSSQAQSKYPLFVTFVGSIKASDHFLGFPVNKEIALTPYDDAQKVVSQFEKDINTKIIIDYKGWAKGGIDQAIDIKPRASNVLGGQQKLKNMIKTFKDIDAQAYFDVNLTNMYKSRIGFMKKTHCAKTLDNSPSLKNRYSLSMYKVDERYDSAYLLKPEKISQAVEKLINNFKDYGTKSISPNSLANNLYSNFNHEGQDRATYKEMVEKSLLSFKDNGFSVSLSAPNAYALPYCDYVFDAPSSSSGYSLFDYDIPFYQMVLSGKANYCLDPVNVTSDFENDVLKTVEYGAGLQGLFTTQNLNKTVKTPYDNLYSTNYELWQKRVAKSYNEIKPLMSKIAASTMVSHKYLQKDVVQTSYSNNIMVYVNYSNKDVKINDTIILRAKSFAFESEK